MIAPGEIPRRIRRKAAREEEAKAAVVVRPAQRSLEQRHRSVSDTWCRIRRCYLSHMNGVIVRTRARAHSPRAAWTARELERPPHRRRHHL